MLNKSISISSQANSLSDQAALLFTWMIAHADDEGRMNGAVKWIKGTVVPLRSSRNWSERCIQNYILDMVDALLIHYWYQAGERFIQFPSWKDHQYLQIDRVTMSKIPAYNQEKAKDAKDFPDLSSVSDLDTARIQETVGLENQYSITKYNIVEFSRREKSLSVYMKGLAKKAEERSRDPRIKRLIDYFFLKVKEKKNFEPDINGARDGYLLKLKLHKYSEEQLHTLIDEFLDAEVSNKLGCSLNVCLSSTIINQWLSGSFKNKPGGVFKA
jgi:hypothetical protein